jgi:hypothetical protein
MQTIGLALRAQLGGAVVVGVAIQQDEPRVVISSLVATATEGDPLSLKPYHVAAGMERGPDGGATAEAAMAVAEGRRRQDALAVKGLDAVLVQLREAECKPGVVALLLNRAGWIPDLLSYSLAWPDHPPVAERLAVREALRFACKQRGLAVAEMDEKSLPGRAAETFALSPADLDARLKTLGADVGRPWRKEQKLACLAAWVALAGP